MSAILSADDARSWWATTQDEATDRLYHSHEALRDRVAVLTEERDELREAEREAVEEAQRALDDLRARAEARVAVLEAGLRVLADAADAMSASRTAWNAPSLNRSLRDAVTAARALLGGVPAAAPEPCDLCGSTEFYDHPDGLGPVCANCHHCCAHRC